MSTIEVKVPDIGDFTDVPVIEVLVKPGDTVKAEDSLVTLESDKATMDVPAPAAGVVKSVERQGRRQGQRRRVAADARDHGGRTPSAATPAAAAPAAPPRRAPARRPSRPRPQRTPAAAATPRGADDYRGAVDIECQMVVHRRRPGRLQRRVPRR